MSHSLRGLSTKKLLYIYDYLKKSKIINVGNSIYNNNYNAYQSFIKLIELMYYDIKKYEKLNIHEINNIDKIKSFFIMYVKNIAKKYNTSIDIINELNKKLELLSKRITVDDLIVDIKSFLRLPDYLIISEFINLTVDKIIERFNQQHRNTL